jgi:hypothetical protein
MKINCLSIPNPYSYLVCYGIKDVDSREWSTDYRGTVYIHSLGKHPIAGMPEFPEGPLPVIEEFNTLMEKIQEMEKSSRYIGFLEHGIKVFLKNEGTQDDRSINEYNLLSDVYTAYAEDQHKPFFLVDAIIGCVELLDVVREARSPWAGRERYHWIFGSPRVLGSPILKVSGGRGVWEFDTESRRR